MEVLYNWTVLPSFAWSNVLCDVSVFCISTQRNTLLYNNFRHVPGEVERLLKEYTQNQEMVGNIGSHYYQIIYPVQLRQHKKMGISTREIGSSKVRKERSTVCHAHFTSFYAPTRTVSPTTPNRSCIPFKYRRLWENTSAFVIRMFDLDVVARCCV